MEGRSSSIISDVCLSRSDGDRQKTKDRLNELFKASDAKLERLMKEKYSHFATVLDVTSKSLKTISDSKSKCHALKERLSNCMHFLQCRRNDIRRLWIESLQHKYVHNLLEEIKSLRKVPDELSLNIMDGKLMHCTEVLVSSLKLLNDQFGNVDALKELRRELVNFSEKLYSVLLEELFKELFMSKLESFYEWLGSYKITESTREESIETLLKRTTQTECVLAMNADNSHIIVLTDCLKMLGKIPDAIDALKENCQKELLILANRASMFMQDSIESHTEQRVLELPDWQQQLILYDLLNTVLNIFRQVSFNHHVFLDVLQKLSEVEQLTESAYEMASFYSKVQTTIEHFVGFYLESRVPTSPSRRSAAFLASSSSISELAGFFDPSQLKDLKPPPLFKFSDSLHGNEMKKCAFEGCKEIWENQDKSRFTRKVKLCQPDLKNIVFLFAPLKNFAKEIEKAVNLEPDMHCLLHTYVLDSVNVFLDQVNSEVNRMLESALSNLEAWNVSIIACDFSEKQLLTSVLILNNKLKELQTWMRYLPDYTKHFIHLIFFMMLDYKDMIQKVFKSLFVEEQNILSVSWAKDRDIRRLLKSYSNWKHLLHAESNDVIEAPEDIRLRNKEESELLIRNLNSEEQASWDIITNFNKLLNIALLEESLDWITEEFTVLIQFVNELLSGASSAAECSFGAGEEKDCSEYAVGGLMKLNKEYQDFQDMCLVALHLEVRAHCFHYLLPFSDQTSYLESNFSKEYNVAVKSLTDELLKVDEILLPVLDKKKLTYIFEGLGELISSLLIHNLSNLHKITDAILMLMGRSIFIIQCCLGNITMTRRESLDRARQYIELFHLSCEEILSKIVEEGPKFQESEYASVLRLLCPPDDQPKSNEMFESYCCKLSCLFKGVCSSF